MQSAQALEAGNLKSGSRVLVHAGAGGVGHIAVQLAKVHFKAYVVATAGPNNLKFVKEVSCASLDLNDWGSFRPLCHSSMTAAVETVQVLSTHHGMLHA